MAISGTVKSFDKKFLFQVMIDGYVSASFSKVSEPKAQVAEVTHWEGGNQIANKSAGRTTFADITLERGASRADLDAYLWFTQVINAPANVGLKDFAYKRHLDIIQRDRDGEIIKRWSIFGAWVKEYTPGDWDNNSDDVVIEKIVLAYDFFKKTL